MSGEREKFDLDFGIEDTTRSADETSLINAVFTGGAIGNPDDITEKGEGDESSTTSKTTTKPTQAAPKVQQTPPKKEEPQINVGDTVLGEEKNEEGEVEDKDKKEVPGAENQEVDKTPFSSLADDFVSLGIFQKGEDEEFKPDMNPEEFMQLYQANKNREINDTINGFLGKFGEDYRDMFQAVFVDGVDPRDYLNTFTKLQDVASLDMTKEESWEKIYREYFRRQGFAQDRIEAKLQKAKAQGDLEDDSTDFHKILVEQDATELAEQSKVKQEKTLQERRQKQAFAQNANKLLVEKVKDKEFDGIPVTDQIAREAFNYLTEEKYRLPSGESLTEFDKAILELRRPENAALKVKLALLLKSGLDLTKVKIKEKNEQTKEAFQWATKGKQITNVKNNTNKSSTFKETEAFI